MTASQWNRATEIFDAALGLSPAERSAFVRASSTGDSALQAEVEGLLAADAEIDGGSFLATGLLLPNLTDEPDLSLQVGEVISGRFRIVRPLGVGGMGRVYQAHDSELGVHVALKTLRPEVATNPEVIRRFHQEVRIAHRITHPNVCRTFHLDRERKHVGADGGDAVDLTFITMEYLEGETLQQILKRVGRLPLSRALSIASQMANAIEAAHQSGIIHRDIKPGNVMICDRTSGSIAEERAVITDFGLAKFGTASLNDDHSTITKTGSAMGTLPYMAPEQILLGEVTPATDIYSFGVVLFEMVTGKKAFPDSVTHSAAIKRAQREAPSVREQLPELSVEWENAISGCLQLDPEARFQSACDVMRVLKGETVPSRLNGSTVAARRRGPARSATARPGVVRRNLRLFLVAAIILACMSLFWFGFRSYQSSADASVAPGTLVYLAPVKNETGEKQLNNVTELVRAGLEQSAHINLLDAARVGDYLQQMTRPPDALIDQPTAREISMRAGAARVIFASVTGSGGKYRLDIDIQQPDSRDPSRYRDHWQKIFNWKNDTHTPKETISPPLASAMRNASDWIRLKVGESEQDILHLNSSPDDVTTGSWEALMEYVRAENLQSQANTSMAVVALQNAVKLDPHFSLAYGRLGDLLFSNSQYQEGLRAYSRALDPEQDRRLTRRERDRILGEFSLDSGDYDSAEKAYRDQTIFYPNEYRGWSYRGYPLLMLGRTDEALSTLKRAYEIDSNRANAPWELARANISIGAFPEALSWAEILEKHGSTESASYVRGIAHYLLRDYAASVSDFLAMQHSRKTTFASLSYLLLARVSAERGDYSNAAQELQDGIAFDQRNGLKGYEANKLTALAFIEAVTDRSTFCIPPIRKSLDLETSSPRLMIAATILGIAHAKAHGPEAIVLRDEILDLEKKLPKESFGVVSDLARLRIRGEALLANGDANAAVVQFRKAAQLDASANGREYLGRALEVAAKHEIDPHIADQLRRSAMVAYEATISRPNLQWLDSADALPGYYAQQLAAHLRLATIATGSRRQAVMATRDVQIGRAQSPAHREHRTLSKFEDSTIGASLCQQ